MRKTILITGSTDGIGLEAAKRFADEGHTVLLHGRNAAKLAAAKEQIEGNIDTFQADLSNLDEIEKLAGDVASKYPAIDVLINNAGILRAPETVTSSGLDVRFMVNTIAPYLLIKRLLPIISKTGRIVNLSSAAQAPVSLEALAGRKQLSDMEAYSQSKLAITMWSFHMARELNGSPSVIALNPGSLLATKMVKDGFGIQGNNMNVGVDIIHRTALSHEFENANGCYFDNDSGAIANPHADALDQSKVSAVVDAIEAILEELPKA